MRELVIEARVASKSLRGLTPYVRWLTPAAMLDP